MASITLRSSLSRGLTNSEVDSNFTNLNNDKAENGANSDITSMSGVTGEIGDPTQIQFDPQSSHPAYSEGLLWYDTIHNTLNYYGDESGLVHEVGIEEHQKVYNNSGVTIAKGEPLYFSGNFNGYPTAARANATDVNKYNAQGIAAHSIENGTYGYVCTAGLVEGVDTSGLNAGTNFFVGLTDGAVQNASPTYPNYPMCLGWVVASDSTNGVLLVNQQNHSVNSFRVRTDTHIGGDLIIDGDLTVVGSQTVASSTNVETGAPFLYLNSGDTIGEANTTFTGSGLDDAYFTGHFSGTASTTYYVKIDGTGTPDTFSWSKDNFSTTEATGVAITGDDQTLDNGIQINFGATTGHTTNDVWSGTAAPVDADTGVWSNRNTGGTGVGYTHVGMFFDVTDSKFKIVDEYDPEPTGTIDTADSSYSAGSLVVDGLEASSATVGGNSVLTTADEGSGNGIDADTVDGLEASQFLRSDQADTTTKSLTVNGLLKTNTADSSADGLNIENTGGAIVNQYFSGSASTDEFVITRSGTGGAEFRINSSGAVRLGHAGNGVKLETTSTGLSVSGSIDMGTNDITDTKVGNWDTAYGWGDHASAGYQDGTLVDGIAYENSATLSRSVGDGQQWVKICDTATGQPQRIYLKVTHTGDNTNCEFEAEISTAGYGLADHILVKNHQRYNQPIVTEIRTHQASSADVEVWIQVEDLSTSNGNLIVRSNKAIPTLTATSTEPTWSNTKVVYLNSNSQNYDVVTANGVLFQDNVKAAFGLAEDFKIYHDGTHTYLEDSGQGNIRYKSDYHLFQNASGTTVASLDDGTNGCRLYNNGTERIHASTTGIDVTGRLTVTDRTLRFNTSSWTNSDHDLINGGWYQNLGDYIYLKAAGNSPSDHGAILVADNGVYFGQMDQTTGTGSISNSATAPLDGANYGYINSSGMTVSGSSITANGNTVWHAGNDGAGSGLDADTLDGNEASAFVSASGDTMSGNLRGTQATTSASWTVLERFFANPAAEAGEQTDIRLINDLAGFNKWGTETLTDVVTSHQGSTARTTLGDAAYDGTSSTISLYKNANDDPNVILLELPYALTYSCWVGVVFGAVNFRARSVKIETFRNGAWQTECDITNSPDHIVSRQVASNDGNGVTKIRYTFDDYNNTWSNYCRIHSLFAVNYRAGNNSKGGVHYLSRYKDDEHYSNIAPAVDSTYALGTSSKRYSNIYSDALDVAGNITVSGTVDGRDIAADGATLDAINLTQYVRSDAADTATGLLTLNGGIHVLSGTGGGKLRIKRNATSTDGDDIADIHMDDAGINIDIDNDNDGDSGRFLVRRKVNGSFTNTLAVDPSYFQYNGNTIWHAGNDGTGSGLDADTVDGVQASSFLRSDATDSATGALTFGNIVTLNGSQTGGYPLIRMTSGSSSYGRIEFGTTADVDEGIIAYNPTSNYFGFTTNAAERFRMEGDGDFHADGDVIAYSTTISDRRLKTDIKNIDDAVEKVKQLNGCTFKRHDGQVSAGVIAQDVETVLPEAIREKELPLHLANDTTTYKLVEYDAIIGLLVESVKELTARVEELENAASVNRGD